MKKQFIKKKLITCGMSALLIGTMLTGKTMATETKDYKKYPNDVTPPWGRISIVGATEVNNINYVDREKVTVQVYANDDMCEDNEISFYVSTSEISRTTEITNWKSLKDGNAVEIDLPSTTSTNTIYAVFKDYNGNTSLIYTGTNQTVTYDANDGTNAPTGGTRTIGAPFVITNQTPEREGYYFLGWSTDRGATEPTFYVGDIIPAEMIIGEGTTATLYAVWTNVQSDLRKLSQVVKVGDYVNYPVYYDNVATSGTSYIAKRNGWRVLSVSGDTVNLVSAGVPLTYYRISNDIKGVTNLAINFLETAFTISGAGYRTTGFSPYKTLTEIFTNKYTDTYETDTTVSYPGYNTTLTGTKTAGTPKVRAMTKDDSDKVYGEAINSNTSVTGAQYNDLLAVPANSGYAYTWLASAYSSTQLWFVNGNGRTSSTGSSSYTYGVRPVVSLKSEVQVTGTDMTGAWNIIISE